MSEPKSSLPSSMRPLPFTSRASQGVTAAGQSVRTGCAGVNAKVASLASNFTGASSKLSTSGVVQRNSSFDEDRQTQVLYWPPVSVTAPSQRSSTQSCT